MLNTLTATHSFVIPEKRDPRWVVLSLLFSYVVVGITFLGFNRTPLQICLIIMSCCALDMLIHKIVYKKHLFPLSAAITGCSLSILVNTAHGIWIPFIPVYFSIVSKYCLTANGRHAFNPSLFGIVCTLWIGEGLISPSPAYQWGGSITVAFVIVTAAILLFALRINRHILIASFLIFYSIQVAIRAILFQHLIPPMTLFMGAFGNPAFYLFAFFMITDPATSPRSKWGQIGMALFIVLFDLILNAKQSYSTLFYSGFAYFSLRWLWINVVNLKKIKYKQPLSRALVFILITFAAYLVVTQLSLHRNVKVDFLLERVDTADAGISTHPSDILNQVDPKIAHVAKWLLSVGDAVAIADVNQDGLMDIFLTYPLKDAGDRAALYINQGNYQFKRMPIPFLTERFSKPNLNGLPAGAIWFDFDNDGDQDLLILVGYGKSILLKNMLMETGDLSFVIEKEFPYTISLSANVVDVNKNGWADLIIANVLPTTLKDYQSPKQLNIFNLPAPEFQGDRRIFNFMHRSWHNARNGGEKLFYMNHQGKYQENSAKALGLEETRWTLDIATGDFNHDGLTDLFLANDFGPDELLINVDGKSFKSISGKFANHIGKDAYKGMNASAADLSGNGHLDIYVSNVHHPLQAEGSQLWINQGDFSESGYHSFTDRAFAKNILNENRFGWGAAVGDINLDGKLDIIQANGMVDDSYDKQYDSCPDYWYWNGQIALTHPDIHGYADKWADLRGRCIFPNELDRIYINHGTHFVDVAEQVGLTATGNSRGVALADLNNDGHLDVIITDQFNAVSIYKNNLSKRNWLGLLLKGNGKSCTKDALGTIVKVGRQYREVQAKNGFSAQSDPRLLFGLEDINANQKIAVNIDWCGNQDTVTYELLPNQYHTIHQN